MIGGDTPPEALGDYTGFLLNWVGRRSRARFERALAEIDLHLRDFAIMSVVGTKSGLTQQEVARGGGIDTSTMVAAIDSLEQRGFVERRVHPQDRRKHAVHLTQSGRRKLLRARELAAAIGEEVFAPLDADEREQLRVLLRKLAGLE